MPTNSCNQGRQKVRLLNKPCHADNNDDEGDDVDDDGGGGDDGDGGDDDDGDDDEDQKSHLGTKEPTRLLSIIPESPSSGFSWLERSINASRCFT